MSGAATSWFMLVSPSGDRRELSVTKGNKGGRSAVEIDAVRS
jgi:hypothetical protein